MKTDFNKWKDSLRAKKYDSIPQKELDYLAANNINRDLVVNSLQRLVSQVISNKVFTSDTSDELLFELISVCNESIATAMNRYTEPNYSFAAYVKCEMSNAIMNYFKFTNDTIKSSVVNGERTRAKYLFLDTLFSIGDDEYEFDIEDTSIELYSSEPITKEYVFSLISKNKVKEKNFELWWNYRIEGAKSIEKADVNGVFNSLTNQAKLNKIHKIDLIIKNNEILKEKIKEFFDLN